MLHFQVKLFSPKITDNNFNFGLLTQILWCDLIQMKATEQYFPVVLFIMLYKVVLTFESVHEILWCDHSNETPSETVQQYFLFFFT